MWFLFLGKDITKTKIFHINTGVSAFALSLQQAQYVWESALPLSVHKDPVSAQVKP